MKNFLVICFASALFAGTATAQFQITSYNPSCSGSCDGYAEVQPAGNYQYLWSDGQIGMAVSNLCAGVYICTVSDNFGNPLDTLSVTLTTANPITVSGTTTNSSGCGWCDGTAYLLVSGGTPPYSAWWSDGSTTLNHTYLCPGTYSTTVVDGNGCTASFSATINDNSNFTATVITSGEIWCSTPSATSILINGGSTPYEIWWGDGTNILSSDNVQTHTYSQPGTYYITIRGIDSCMTSVIDTVERILPYSLTTSKTNQNCSQLGTAAVHVTGGAPPFTYEWSTVPPQYTDSVSGLFAGTYYVTISDNTAGCSVTERFDITNLNPLSASATSTPEVCDFDNGTATVIPLSGTPPYTFVWNTSPVQTTATATSLSQGQYTVTFTDANLCSGQRTMNVGYTSPVQPNAVVVNEVCGGGNGSITLTPTLGTPPYTYHWSNGGTTNAITNLNSSTYSFTLDDMQGCTVTGSRYVQDVPPFNVNITYTSQTCLAPGSATANVTGSSGPYTYKWSTIPPQTAAIATGLTAGYYYCTVTDANGCTSVRSVSVQYDPMVQANLTASPALCLTPTGSIDISTFGSGQPPYSYAWSNGAVTEDITGVTKGYYTVTITDANNCSIVKSKYVDTYSHLNVSITTVNASCIFTNDGQATATPSNGTPPFTYRWGNGATTQTVTGLPADWRYGVIVTDVNGCTVTRCSVPIGYNDLSCAVQVDGKVVKDADADCDLTPGDVGMMNVPVHCIPGYADMTDVHGDYSFIVPPGNYALTHVPPYHTFQKCPEGSVTLFGMLPGDDTIVNFYDTVRAALDLSIGFGYLTVPRPGFEHDVTMSCENKGNVIANAIVEFSYDTLLSFVSATNFNLTHNAANRKLIFTYNNFLAGERDCFIITFATPATAGLGTQVKDCAMIYPVINDVNFTNNAQCDSTMVVGSYDPNDKAVSPVGYKIPGNQGFYISQADSILHYRIRFQNTGTYYAQHVAIRDTLDEDLDITSIHDVIASHEYRLDFYMNKYLVFYFDNILLPDSFSNEKESHGYVSFRIKQKPQLPTGTFIHNRAAIYFDYNEPVITNTVSQRIAGVTDIGQALQPQESLLAFPNPAHDKLYFVLKNADDKILRAELLDLSGKLCRTAAADFIELASLSPGMYLYRVTTQTGRTYTGKLLKE